MGESIFEGTVTKWLKNAGDKVGRDEPLFEISTDKVDSEIPCPADGMLSEILVPAGQTVKINTVVAIIEEAEAGVTAVRIPVDSTTAIEADANPEVASPEEAAPAIEIGARNVEPAPVDSRDMAANEQPPVDVRTSPLVRRIARDHGIDLSALRGTGLSGRITKDDILAYLEKLGKTEAGPAPAPPMAAPVEVPPNATPSLQPVPVAEVIASIPPPQPQKVTAPTLAASPVIEQSEPAPTVEVPRFMGEMETVTMTPMRKAIAEHMVLSRRTSAHVQTVFEVDMTSIVQLREQHKDEFEAREGIKLTYTAFFVKALVDTVGDFPILNCSVSGDTITFKKPINVGLAVALDTGLIVPVIKDAASKSFNGLALAIHDLAERARAKKLMPEEVQNGTITITNPGVYGSLFGTPIINQPQVAILGVGSLEKRPVIINDAIAIRTMVYLVLSFDHRVIDGAVADQAMAALKARLQSWPEAL
jgi:2-oxoglutarate dehydrogenase E2 component (dihydrolipoamide succinyltransferase)